MIGLSHVADTGRYGRVMYEDDRVVAFREKDASGGSGWVNNGCYILSPHIFEQYDGAYSMERDVFVDLGARKELYVYRTKSEFADIGMPDDYRRFVALFSKEK